MTKLAGQIVQMSQHKFASNVVEKCLEFGGPTERQILISEMLGHTDENEPLQVLDSFPIVAFGMHYRETSELKRLNLASTFYIPVAILSSHLENSMEV